MGEFDFIRWLRRSVSATSGVWVGIGDDCAVLRPTATPTLMTTDMLLDGRHFHLAQVGAERVGRKSLAVNLSDIAAMAGRPTAAVISLALPRRHTRDIAEQFFRGLSPLANDFGVAIVGGDTNTWDGPLVVSITLLGDAGKLGPVLRSGARPGDWLFVTGSLGGSLLGKHLDFVPRVREAQRLREFCNLHAMIDISDGLAADVGHIAEESQCGVVLFADQIPISDAAHRSDPGITPLQHALGDGEDFELAFAVSPEDGQRLIEETVARRDDGLGVELTRIGLCINEPGLYLETAGTRHPLPPLGFVHSFDEP